MVSQFAATLIKEILCLVRHWQHKPRPCAPAWSQAVIPKGLNGKADGSIAASVRCRGLLARLSIDRRAGLRKVAAAIGRQGEALTALDTAQLDNLRIELRRRFRSRGLSNPLCIRAFALIRELAERTIHLRHYDSQLMAGWVMLQGQLAEMETGEGKTLAATLAAATAALAGIPVHVITVNEYLVERDAKVMGPLYRALGLTVGYVTQSMATGRAPRRLCL